MAGEIYKVSVWLRSGKQLDIKGAIKIEENGTKLKITTINDSVYEIEMPAVDVIMKKIVSRCL